MGHLFQPSSNLYLCCGRVRHYLTDLKADFVFFHSNRCKYCNANINANKVEQNDIFWGEKKQLAGNLLRKKVSCFRRTWPRAQPGLISFELTGCVSATLQLRLISPALVGSQKIP